MIGRAEDDAVFPIDAFDEEVDPEDVAKGLEDPHGAEIHPFLQFHGRAFNDPELR